jgi:hypothetical protein
MQMFYYFLLFVSFAPVLPAEAKAKAGFASFVVKKDIYKAQMRRR